MQISVAGIGYVGLSLAVLLSQKHEVKAFDLDEDKIKKVNNRITPIKDQYIEEFFLKKKLNLKATSNPKEAFISCKYLIISTPTNYDVKQNKFDTASIESVIKNAIEINKNIFIIIKSTIPVGYVEKVRKQFKYKNIFFSPEFLREGYALYDNLYPSRIIVGDKHNVGKDFSKILLDCVMKEEKQVPVLLTDPTEAEAIKLFSNSYLAMRVAYFNELDNYALRNKLNSHDIILGSSYDSRIGNYYNNPSFGYGGYCLPKDTKQLMQNFHNVPNDLIKAIVKSNETRKHFIADDIASKKPNKIGVYRLIMKSGSDNFRQSAIMDIIAQLNEREFIISLYEPLIDDSKLKKITELSNMKLELENDLNVFKNNCDVIIANRNSKELHDVENKLYTRDIFGSDN